MSYIASFFSIAGIYHIVRIHRALPRLVRLGSKVTTPSFPLPRQEPS